MVPLLADYVRQGGQLVLAAGAQFDPALWQEQAWLNGQGILPLPLVGHRALRYHGPRLLTRALMLTTVRHAAARAGFFFTLDCVFRSGPHRVVMAGFTAVSLALSTVLVGGGSRSPAADVWGIPVYVFATQTISLAVMLFGFVHVTRLPADVTASRLLRRAKVRGYIAALSRQATQQAERQRNAAVAGILEVLQRMTAMIRFNAADCLGDDGLIDPERIRALPPEQRCPLVITHSKRTDAKGRVHIRQAIKLDPVALAAGKVILDHHESHG